MGKSHHGNNKEQTSKNNLDSLSSIETRVDGSQKSNPAVEKVALKASSTDISARSPPIRSQHDLRLSQSQSNSKLTIPEGRKCDGSAKKSNDDKKCSVLENSFHQPGMDTEKSSRCLSDLVDKQEDNSSLDSYGIPKFVNPHQDYRNFNANFFEQKHVKDWDFYVPWNLRQTNYSKRFTFFDFLRSPQFWKQIEFASRITFFAVLIPSLFMIIPKLANPFVSYFFVFSSMALASRIFVGEAFCYLFSWMRSGLFWLPLVVIAAALNLGNNTLWWCIYYTFFLFIMALFTEDISRRICLLLFNICMVTLLINKKPDLIYPCRVMADWCIGILLCTLSTFIPYPKFCHHHAECLIFQISMTMKNTLQGIMHSFWSESNVKRNMAMSRVRDLAEYLNQRLSDLESCQKLTIYEFFAESSEARQIRTLKFAFFERLRVNISTLLKVLNTVENNPTVVDDSERSQAFKEIIAPCLLTFSSAFDSFMTSLALAKSKTAIEDMKFSFDSVYKCTFELQEAFTTARRIFLYECTYDTFEAFVPLMAFYLFTLVSFSDTVAMFQQEVKQVRPSLRDLFNTLFHIIVHEPFHGNLIFLKKLFLTANRREIQRVLEAAKVSGAMIVTVGCTILLDIDSSSFTGPNIIAFVSGMNPVESVQASIVRLTGCLIGTVLGFFAGAYSQTEKERVALLCVLVFCCTFFRNDKDYGIMSVYAMFVLIPLVSIDKPTIKDTMDRMNQNTMGIFIYLLISILVLPLSPSVILRQKRINILKRINEALVSIANLFSDPFSREEKKSDFATYFTQAGDPALHVRCEAETEKYNVEETSFHNYSFYMIKSSDIELEKITTILDDIDHRIKASKSYVDFSKEERGLVEVDYPVRACAETYEHMRIMLVLLRAMWMSWRLFRRQRLYTSEMRRLMIHLHPIAKSISNFFTCITNLIVYNIQNPTVNLETEITKFVLSLLESCKELQARMNQMLVIIVNKSVQRFRDPSTVNVTFPRLLKNAAHLSPENTAFSPTTEHMEGAGDFVSAAMTLEFAKSKFGRKKKSETRSLQWNRNDDADTDVIEKSVLSKKHRENLHFFVHLPENFEFPISSEDAECLHSFALSLLMFANETKMLTTSLQVMTEHARSKK